MGPPLDQANLMQMYQGRLPKKKATDVESIDDDVYADFLDQSLENAPQGLVDRLSQEEYDPDVMKTMRPAPPKVPTTRGYR